MKKTKRQKKLFKLTPPKGRQLQVFTYFPPNDTWPEAWGPEQLNRHRAHVLESGLLIDESWLALMLKKGSFENTQNPVYAIEALLLAHELELYPPKWAIDFLASRFKLWHERQGKDNLEKVLGLKTGRGVDPAFKQDMMEERDEMLALDVARLIELGAPISIDAAAALVAYRLTENKQWDRTGWKLGNIKEDRIKRAYRKTWKPYFDEQPRLKSWSKPQIAEYLKQFRYELLTDKLKKMALNK